MIIVTIWKIILLPLFTVFLAMQVIGTFGMEFVMAFIEWRKPNLRKIINGLWAMALSLDLTEMREEMDKLSKQLDDLRTEIEGDKRASR